MSHLSTPLTTSLLSSGRHVALYPLYPTGERCPSVAVRPDGSTEPGGRVGPTGCYRGGACRDVTPRGGTCCDVAPRGGATPLRGPSALPWVIMLFL